VIIKNSEELATTQQRKHALKIIESGIAAVLPNNIMKSKVEYKPDSEKLIIDKNTIDIKSKRLFVIGGGKAAGLMAEALEEIITPQRITAGIVICNTGNYKTQKIKIHEAGHPIPDVRGINGVRQILALKDKFSINENDSIICLLSGGGSALMPYPVNEIGLEDQQAITKLLLQSGADIHELNIVRCNISRIKGGRLARYFAPCKIISLIISDVVGNDLTAIASGPTINNPYTYSDAFKIIKKYNLQSRTPKSILKYLQKKMQIKDQDKSGGLNNIINIIIADNKIALAAMAENAKKLGYTPKIITAELQGEPNRLASEIAQKIISREFGDYNVLLFGGETTPTIQDKHGKGGRNQHFAASSLITMKDYSGNWLVASVATDGRDFEPEVAGAIVDNEAVKTTVAQSYDVQSYLDNYDSYSLLKKIGKSLLITHSTGTNVGDIIIYILQ
jgi:glycerate-2-kinase